MFGSEHYVPILKGKRGEYDALRDLADDVRGGLTPLIEVPPVPWDFVADQPAKDLDSHLGSSVERLAESWRPGEALFLDVLCDDAGLTAAGRHPLDHLVDELETRGLAPIPVTSLAPDDAYRTAVHSAAGRHGRGVCLRITEDDVDDPASLRGAVDGIVANLGLARGEVDLVIDLGGLAGAGAKPLELVARGAVHAVPHIEDWRTLILSMAAFPASVADKVSTNTIGSIRREDAVAYRQLVTKALPRTPTFSDYGADSPEYPELDPRVIRPAAHIRYTVRDEWIVHRGVALRGPTSPGYAQFHQLAEDLAHAAHFMSGSHCAGDRFIEACASGVDGPGNLTNWRTVATSHHLSHVVLSLASSGDP